jgi:phage terminase Nu1 subunit (DNA packaging protein)
MAVDALNFIGLPWPAIDEDELHHWANDVREFATEVTQISQLSHDAVQNLKNTNQSGVVKTMAENWEHHHSEIMGMRGPLHDFAEALDVAADAVLAQKIIVSAAVVALAIEIIATQGEAIFTFGLAEAEVPVEVALTKVAVKFALQELENQIIGCLINQAADEVTKRVGQSVTKMLKGSTNVVFEAVSLKADYASLQNLAATAQKHKNRTEQASMKAKRQATSRKVETHESGGRWHVVEVLLAALKSIAEEMFEKLPGVLHTVLDDLEKDLKKAIAKLKKTDQDLAGHAPKPIHEGTPQPNAGPTGPGGPGGPGGTGPHGSDPGGIPLNPQPSWHGQSAGVMKHHKRPALQVDHLDEHQQIQVLENESRSLANDARDETLPKGTDGTPGKDYLRSGCAGSLLHNGVITSHTSTTQRNKGHEMTHPEVHPVLQGVLDKIKSRGAGHGKCAEISLISDRLRQIDPSGNSIKTVKDARHALSGSIIHTRQIGDMTDRAGGITLPHGEYKPPCRSCEHILPALGVTAHQ